MTRKKTMKNIKTPNKFEYGGYKLILIAILYHSPFLSCFLSNYILKYEYIY